MKREMTEAERHQASECITNQLVEILTDKLRDFFKKEDTFRNLKAAGRKGKTLDRTEKARKKAGDVLLGLVEGIVHPGESATAKWEYEQIAFISLAEQFGYGNGISILARAWAKKNLGNAGMANWLRSMADELESTEPERGN